MGRKNTGREVFARGTRVIDTRNGRRGTVERRIKASVSFLHDFYYVWWDAGSRRYTCIYGERLRRA